MGTEVLRFYGASNSPHTLHVLDLHRAYNTDKNVQQTKESESQQRIGRCHPETGHRGNFDYDLDTETDSQVVLRDVPTNPKCWCKCKTALDH